MLAITPCAEYKSKQHTSVNETSKGKSQVNNNKIIYYKVCKLTNDGPNWDIGCKLTTLHVPCNHFHTNFNKPVSYTHLDVYKRQHPYLYYSIYKT